MTEKTSIERLQVWGGVEPTINRIGDQYFRQFDRSGHAERVSDLDEFARIGLRTLRFPILWEEVAPDSPDEFNWSNVDAGLQRLLELGIRPIAGLLHHGSGPHYTSLVDPEFPEKLAAFARAVAERYPWIDAYTPVNEPLTTARFSGMYGIWYPHGRDEETFARCLINQCRGVALAMLAIREVNPSAELVQTDDLGKTYSTQKLQYQADYENERRWVTWDLLTGTLDPKSAMWSSLRGAGIPERELAAFQENPCPPDIIGINHYITSERFLDDNLAAHPPETHGGNGCGARYADVVAVRIRREQIGGAEGVLREAWNRYGLPLAVTEAHLGCTREEQLRWFMEVWDGARKVRTEGVDVRAVTVWSLLGAFDWNSLLTRQDGFYESGAYDVRGGEIRATAVAKMIEELAHGRDFNHPILATPGWWRRRLRLHSASGAGAGNPCISESAVVPPSFAATDRLAGAPIIMTGATGRLAQGFIRAAELRGLPYRVFSHADLDITDGEAIAVALRSCSPWAVINCAGFSNVDAAETEENACMRINAGGAATLAALCARSGTPLVTFSSDHVFDGNKREPYVESDTPNALNVYGESKLLAEQQVLSIHPGALVIRPGKVFAPLEDYDFLRRNLRAIARGESVRVENDVVLTGTYLPDLVHATLDLLVDGERGIWHLANIGAVTPEQFLIAAADASQLNVGHINGAPLWELNRAAPRAHFRALTSERGQLLPPLRDAIERYCRESPPVFEERAVLAATS
ncbi:MAG: sugar nucleotide-binding protein [Verrucomicrobiota bacterium]|nr:sugar nucleotide-binding protein [Verrucomicrobiota bacterium]